jgi:hypothetical protein
MWLVMYRADLRSRLTFRQLGNIFDIARLAHGGRVATVTWRSASAQRLVAIGTPEPALNTLGGLDKTATTT